MSSLAAASVVAVARDAGHNFSKPLQDEITLLEGLGVKGDAHCGVTVKNRSRVKLDPTTPNLRQVHLIHAELFDEVSEKALKVLPGDMGENITTRGIDLLGLPTGARLRIGTQAVVEITGLRNPCSQIEAFQKGLLKACLDKNEEGELVRKSGVMGIVVSGGKVRPGDEIRCEFPPEPHRRLEKV